MKKAVLLLAMVLFLTVHSSAATNEITAEQLMDLGWSKSGANALIGSDIRLTFLATMSVDASKNYLSYYDALVRLHVTGTAGSIFQGICDDGWMAIGSSPTENAIDHLGMATNQSIAGYTVNGIKIFDDYDDLWDGSLDHAINMRVTGLKTSDNYHVWTGTQSDGTASANPLGVANPYPSPMAGYVTYGLCQSTTDTWLDADTATYGAKKSWYAMSPVLTVTGPEIPGPTYYGFDYPLLFDMYACPSKADPGISPSTNTSTGYIAGYDEISPGYYPGAPWNPIAPNFINGFIEAERQNRPVTMFMDPRSAPIPITGTENLYPDALQTVLDYRHEDGGRMDFIVMDFEPTGGSQANANITAVVNMVRGNSDPNLNQARLGCYAYSPGAYNGTGNFYESSGLNVAMPQMYAYSYYTYLYGGSSKGDPNDRAALFSTPLELVSRGARGLPEGHLLIPFVAGFDDRNAGSVDAPPHEDTQALLQHVRLRGADGYYLYRSLDESWYDPALPEDTYGNENLRSHMLEAWHELDWLFEYVEKDDIDFMNLDTRTVYGSGLEWSGVETPNGVAILVSYLGEAAGYWFDVPDIAGYGSLPDQIYITAGTHQLITAEALAFLMGDANHDGVVSAGDYAAVQANFGNTGEAGLLGDANGDGVVSAGDYAAVQANFGNTASGAEHIPEPVTCVLLSVSGAMMLFRRRR